MGFLFDLVFETFVEGIFVVVYYLFNKFLKHKVSEKTVKIIKIISRVVSVSIIIGACIIIIFAINKMFY